MPHITDNSYRSDITKISSDEIVIIVHILLT